jgi:hypothetical protein
MLGDVGNAGLRGDLRPSWSPDRHPRRAYRRMQQFAGRGAYGPSVIGLASTTGDNIRSSTAPLFVTGSRCICATTTHRRSPGHQARRAGALYRGPVPLPLHTLRRGARRDDRDAGDVEMLVGRRVHRLQGVGAGRCSGGIRVGRLSSRTPIPVRRWLMCHGLRIDRLAVGDPVTGEPTSLDQGRPTAA